MGDPIIIWLPGTVYYDPCAQQYPGMYNCGWQDPGWVDSEYGYACCLI